MKLASLFALGLLFSTVQAFAQDSLRLPVSVSLEESASDNPNNIKYVNFRSYSINDTHEAQLRVEPEAELSPSYLDAYTTSGLWKQGWFVSASAAVSAFVGDPIGCEDIFGRAKPAVQVSIGKWFIPSTGLRILYQGWDMKNGTIDDQQYHSTMADWMLDLAALWYKGESAPRATIIPFVGCGYMLNKSVCSHSFGLHYGLIGSLRLASRWNLNLELSDMNTFKDFDGLGNKCNLGDHLLNASIGLSYSVGSKHRQRRVVDAVPYMEQNACLLHRINGLDDDNRYLASELKDRDKTVSEYKKILEIKGWLSDVAEGTGSGRLEDNTQIKNKSIAYPYNNYSGLNSLRDRLSKKTEKFNSNDRKMASESYDPDNFSTWDNPITTYSESADSLATSTNANSQDCLTLDSAFGDHDEYLKLLLNRKAFIGAPILFFFELNSARLTDMSQLVNLKEIADVSKLYGLHIRIVGAADSATGTESKNSALSTSRADYIGSELEKLGVPVKQIHKSHLGGIDSYSPSVANRNTRLELYL